MSYKLSTQKDSLPFKLYNMKHKINITISGLPGVGKSTITYLIKDCLENHGFDISFNSGVDFVDETQFDESMKLHLNERIQAIKSKSELYISELQLQRNLNTDDER